MQICLATRPQSAGFIPLALLGLEAMLVQRGGCGAADVAIFEAPTSASGAEIAEHILRLQPDVVGLSCYIWNALTLLEPRRSSSRSVPASGSSLAGPRSAPSLSGS